LYFPPRVITKIFTENKEIVYELKKAPIRVLDEKTAWTVHSVLREVMKRGTGYHPALISFAGKTGTTDGGSFICAYDDEILASVWVGFSPQKYRSAAEYYGKGTAPKTILARFLNKLSIGRIFKPPDVSVF
jgi:membrane peptidoglycan carboxypeptidase